MIPLRDSVRSRRLPFVTVILITINVVVFVRQVFYGPQVEAIIAEYALIPAQVMRAGPITLSLVAHKIVPFFSALFLHGGWVHLLSNMWYLWIFGDNVEDRLGAGRFFLLYCASGVAGNIAHTIAHSDSLLPVIGASGAVAGVLGAYFIFFPRARIMTLLPIVIFWTVAEIPAFFFIGIWFLLQFLNGFFALPCGSGGGCIAWWSHIGGFVSGMVIAGLWRRR